MTAVSPPARGDIVWIQFNPQAGHEQAGQRPALVVSPASFNARSELALLCPITSRRRGHRYETPLPVGLEITGVVLCHHVKSLDWRSRGARFVCRAPDEIVRDVIAKIKTLLD